MGDLVAMRQLGCRTIAGSGGLDRPVVWAHSCELDDPWNWVATDELLMTTGMCIPSDEALQIEMIRRLHKAGIAGMAIGDDLKAPPLTDGMLDEANALDLPILSVLHSTPFSAIGRTVGVATQSEQISRIARLSRLYEVARSATLADSSLLDRLSTELGHPSTLSTSNSAPKFSAAGDACPPRPSERSANGSAASSTGCPLARP
ncbi:PucR family transcriptional regulator ligand-binding domain-containing protein [Prescottella equi]|uniref:PucR family transcriptional regulator ligand-binding domain-containing protein n=1 Tax=Rhodococcus hoagii TaxID=43767 RepID=UPI0030101FC0